MSRFTTANYSSSHQPSNRAQTSEEKLMVAVRIRPLKPDEGERIIHCVDDKTVIFTDEPDKNSTGRQKRNQPEKQYIFDFAFGENSTQDDVYRATTQGLVRDVLLGFNATVFAYGATGAGKTHTMVGTPSTPGIMVRALNDLFNSISMLPNKDEVEAKLSYLELYNENIRDLLNPSSGFLELREDSANNTTVAGLTELSAQSTQEVMGLLLRGNRERSVESTAANRVSSRSHALLCVTVTQQRRMQSLNTLIGRLYMLDLAGSERASNTKNRGKRLVEGAHINRSLLALGNVINALSGGGKYVNYRDSKLTRLLRQALSGNSRTVMVAHVAPSALHKDETSNTLLYASRAAGISRKVEKNELDVSFHVNEYRNIISDLRNEIARLKEKVTEGRPPSANRIPSADGGARAVTPRATGTPVKQLRDQIIATFREQMKLRRRLMDIDGHLLSLGVEAERQHQIISQWESTRTKLYTPSSRQRPNTQSSSEQDDWSGIGTTSTSSGGGSDLNVHQAWSELSYIEREQERYVALRSTTIRELDQCRARAVALENELPAQLDSETEREMLSLLIRVHELEADKVALQGERLVESHELRRRGEMLQRLHRQQRLTDDIITRQRHLMEELKITLPADLLELYSLYQQEIHATTFNTDTSGIPYTVYDPLPPIKEGESLFDRPARTSSSNVERYTRTVESDTGLRTSSGGSSGSEWDNTLPPLNNNNHNNNTTGKHRGVVNNNHNNNHQTNNNVGTTSPVDYTSPEGTPPPVVFPPLMSSK